MPIIDIEAIGGEQHAVPNQVLRKTADALGDALGMAPGKVWLRLRVLPKEAYAESGTDAERTPEAVFVRVLRSRVPQGPDLEREIVAVTKVVANCLGKPEVNVHVEYAPPGLGRIAFGGRLSK
jgi:phenylpyruvate tautomerase PptA (4-oxalocrotonate tautomerase family)